MTTQTVTIEVAPQVARILLALQRRAEAEGISLDALLLPLVPPNEEARDEASVEMTLEERANDFVRWLKAHSVTGVIADDSRESIYTREDEAL
ncbi:MAG: hypothetical protein L0312_00020 [Acidobacteria bacterium]|nr:hypothetical protein [Acidobacteriota bacterium]